MEAGDSSREWHILRSHSDVCADDAALRDQLARNQLRGVNCDGEAEALSWDNSGGVDADYLAARADQWSAGIAGVKGSVGLDDVVDEAAGLSAQGAAEGAD